MFYCVFDNWFSKEKRSEPAVDSVTELGHSSFSVHRQTRTLFAQQADQHPGAGVVARVWGGEESHHGINNLVKLNANVMKQSLSFSAKYLNHKILAEYKQDKMELKECIFVVEPQFKQCLIQLMGIVHVIFYIKHQTS